MKFSKNPLYEQWLEAPDRTAFVNSLDDMARGALLNSDAHQYYREKEYPDPIEFNDAWVKNDADALNKYRADCLAVKEKYPKPE